MASKIHIIGGYIEPNYTWAHKICSSEVFFCRATEIFGLPVYDAMSLGQTAHDVLETHFIFEIQQAQAFSYLTIPEYEDTRLVRKFVSRISSDAQW